MDIRVRKLILAPKIQDFPTLRMFYLSENLIRSAVYKQMIVEMDHLYVDMTPEILWISPCQLLHHFFARYMVPTDILLMKTLFEGWYWIAPISLISLQKNVEEWNKR